MQDSMSALLVGPNEDLLQALKGILGQLGVKTETARNCEEARRVLEQPNPPELVFTEVILSDGTWSAVVAMAANANLPVSLIVVSEVVDYTLFIDTLENGAADFLMPPFFATDVGCVIRSVRERARSRADERAQRSPAA